MSLNVISILGALHQMLLLSFLHDAEVSGPFFFGEFWADISFVLMRSQAVNNPISALAQHCFDTITEINSWKVKSLTSWHRGQATVTRMPPSPGKSSRELEICLGKL